MKNITTMENKEKNINTGKGELMNRKDAIKKVGITALTAASLLFLETKSASAVSPGAGTADRPARAPGRGR